MIPGDIVTDLSEFCLRQKGTHTCQDGCVCPHLFVFPTRLDRLALGFVFRERPIDTLSCHMALPGGKNIPARLGAYSCAVRSQGTHLVAYGLQAHATNTLPCTIDFSIPASSAGVLSIPIVIQV